MLSFIVSSRLPLQFNYPLSYIQARGKLFLWSDLQPANLFPCQHTTDHRLTIFEPLFTQQGLQEIVIGIYDRYVNFRAIGLVSRTGSQQETVHRPGCNQITL